MSKALEEHWKEKYKVACEELQELQIRVKKLEALLCPELCNEISTNDTNGPKNDVSK